MSRLPVLGLGTLWHFYRTRLRTQAAQELLALAGIAAGVALIFAVEVANTSVTGSVQKLVRGVTGDADLQVAARGGTNFEANVEQTVEAIPGVRVAAPALEQRAGLSGPAGSRAIDLIGVTPELGTLGGGLMEGLGTHGVRLSDALVLPQPLAKSIGVGPGDRARLTIDGRTRLVPISLTVSSDQLRRPRPEPGRGCAAGVHPAPHRPARPNLARAGLDRARRRGVGPQRAADSPRPASQRRSGDGRERTDPASRGSQRAVDGASSPASARSSAASSPSPRCC